MKKTIFPFVFGAAAILAFVCLDWLLMAEDSPLQHYLLAHGEIQNFWRVLNLIPYIGGMMASGNVHQPSPFGYYAVAVMQWFLLGWMLPVLFYRFRPRP